MDGGPRLPDFPLTQEETTFPWMDAVTMWFQICVGLFCCFGIVWLNWLWCCTNVPQICARLPVPPRASSRPPQTSSLV